MALKTKTKSRFTQDSNSISNFEESANLTGRKCNFPGCRSKRTFKRNYELQRHMKMHERRETFDCPAVNCKYRGPKAFYRPDKLKAHVNAAHDEHTMFACPVAGCLSARTAVSRDILALHIRNHDHGACKPYWDHFKALENCDKNRPCPVAECSQKLDLDSLQEHIMQHNEEERNASHIGITITGFDPSTAFVICPFPECQIRLPQLMAFQDHIIEHTLVDLNHFRAWRDQLPPWGVDDSPPWQGWEVTAMNPQMVHLQSKPSTYLKSTNDHLKLLKPVQELYPYREQILRLYPGFGTHPVFQDIMPAIHRRAERVP